MRIINLASGSKGNLTYIEENDTKLLVDIGFHCQETVKRLSMLGISPTQIDGIIISHEHGDHIRGADVFSKKYGTPIYAHSDVWTNLNRLLPHVNEKNKVCYDSTFEIKDFVIDPIELPHDVKCYGHSFKNGEKKISVLTDLGHTTDKIMNAINESQIVYLEANYDREMLYNGTRYSYSLKRRIDGPNGHLSNEDSAKAIRKLINSGTRQIVLSHLSEENNSPDVAYKYMCAELAKWQMYEGVDFKIDVATQRPGVIFRLK